MAVLLFAFFLADLLSRAISAARDQSDRDRKAPSMVSKLVYWLVVTIGSTMAVEQVGVGADLVEHLLQIMLGVAAASVGLAFSLGARDVFRNLMARHYAERLVRTGDHVRVADRVGTVLGFSPTALMLDTSEGQEIIPCRVFLETRVVILDDKSDTKSGT